MKMTFMKAAAVALSALVAVPAAQAADLEKMTYLYPAPDFLPAFTPFQVARTKGYYEDEGLDVNWVIGKGGADVAKQVAVGNAELGGGIGDTPIIVRANGLPVKGVLLMGGKALTQMVIRSDSGATDMTSLKGKKVGVIAYQDTTYYNLLAALAANGMTKEDIDIQAVGAGGMVQLMISGDLDAISGTPDWAAAIEGAGVDVAVQPINDMFPAMAQAVLTSEDTMKNKPEVVTGFVQATLHGLKDVMTDPEGSAKLLAESIPQYAGKEAFLLEVMNRYNSLVYAVDDMDSLGTFDEARMKAVAEFYLDAGIVSSVEPAADYYSNDFVTAE
ncbi:ABC transporter substrate-binding protein [Pseudooceanicola sediminis]|uniref:ABC transporter substrate-binding protein n=1 Tax=Pseudooceanicola sediminis TaxID=2211117 RepID=A0A399J3D9_9RHOB|nr:ABC transporter substrate-binding protein [Pseudooceanicola sediminis]KAA2314299.1 ABC transporter substrate-binding protein [Puniceibacterium sp. HSS470]RII39845.1 ABC transporter substrate-binding protein [Pseudooceanicola sediminis]|tara:strand:+ start:28161 stop:29150 length:990 start_codon:yes stop_codon:yes gene_type:complete